MEIILDGILPILPIIIIILIVFYRINLPKFRGNVGEARVKRQLRKLNNERYKVFNDVLIKTDNSSSQIDHIIVSIYGIFIIETKNYSGWIFGNENSEYWSQSIYKTKTKFRNPIKQNWAHVYTLREVLPEFGQLLCYPIVVFVGSGVLKNIVSNIPVIYGHQLFQTVINKSETPILTIEQVNNIADKLKEINIQDKKTRKEHIHQVRDHIYNQNRMVKSLVCPKCGGDLVIRDGKFGRFYGCSNYPKCRYKLSLGHK